VSLNKKGKTNLYHLRHFSLFKFQIAFLVQLRCMSSKHIPISLLGGSHVSSPYLPQILCRSTNQTYNAWFGLMMSIVSTGKPYVLLNKKGERNLHHLRHFLLFTFQYECLVQLCFKSIKHLRISSFGENHVSSPYLAQIVCRSTNQTSNIWFGYLVSFVSTGKP
jgi:hypothetical protein